MRRFLLILTGLLLVQTAWVLAVVPFRAVDEHHQAFRAAAVGHGDLSLRHSADPHGDGELVWVPTSFVEAAYPMCDALLYLNRAECLGAEEDGAGMTLVGTWYSRYNPVYYAVVGTAARPFNGVGALYVMRAATALWCSLMLAAGLAVLTRGRRSRAAGAAGLLALTPTLIFSSAMVSPTGPELCAAFLLWCCLLRLVTTDDPTPTRSWLWGLVATAGSLLVTFRTLGPLWCVCIVAAVAVLAGRRRLSGVVREGPARWSALVVGAATVLGLGWKAVARTNQYLTDYGDNPGSPVVQAVTLLDDWLVQMVGQFPARNEGPAPVVPLVVVGAWTGLVVAFLRSARASELRSWVLVMAISLAVPLGFTVVTWKNYGDMWQGRYGYPVVMGMLLMAGACLGRDDRSDGPWWVRPVVATVLVGAHLMSLVAVLSRQRDWGPGFAELGAPTPDFAVLGLLCVAGGVALVVGTFSRPRPALATSRVPEASGEPIGHSA